MAGSVWLAWEVVKQPFLLRAPAALALRLAPTSPEVLRRAAEQSLIAGDVPGAIALSDASLRAAPFNARALRVRGLSAARQNEGDAAEQMLTLAGNWTLRDDPTHAYLVEQRLRRGNYTSSFAHADTLVRRRVDLQPQIFNLFKTAALSDRRSMGPLVGLLAADPPWRAAFFGYLNNQPDGDALLLTLGANLQKTSHPLTNIELRRQFQIWLGERRLPAMRLLREHIRRPPLDIQVQNSGFDLASADQLQPFDWQLGTGPGLNSQISRDDLDSSNQALRIGYDGYGTHPAAYQLLMLSPGAYVLTGRERLETSPDNSRLRWTVSCLGDDTPIGQAAAVAVGRDGGRWRSFTTSFTVPVQNCSAQWLRLMPQGGDRRVSIAVWYDDIRLTSASDRR